MNPILTKRFENSLNNRKARQLYRELIPLVPKGHKHGLKENAESDHATFSSNDYLGLSTNKTIADQSQKALEEFGTGSSASRYLSGNNSLYKQLETKTAEIRGKEAALCFASGYQMNVGIFSALCQPGDLIFSDELNHASLIDGMRLSKAQTIVYPHSNIQRLDELLATLSLIHISEPTRP